MAKKESKNENKVKKHFFKDFKAELKKVIWPTPKQLFNNAVAVLTIVLITAVIVFALDFTFEAMNKYGINKIKEVVSNSETNEITDQNSETTEENTEISEEVVEETSEDNEVSNAEVETEGNTENAE